MCSFKNMSKVLPKMTVMKGSSVFSFYVGNLLERDELQPRATAKLISPPSRLYQNIELYILFFVDGAISVRRARIKMTALLKFVF